jgi:V-type H+-transporting ATPase subunit E
MQSPPLIPQPLHSAQSTLTNKSRLKLLHRREEHLQDLFSTARSSILALAKDDGRYTQFLEGVIVQGFLQLMEANVTLLCRKKDGDIVKQAADAASKSYDEISGREVKFEIENSLSDDGCVIILCDLKYLLIVEGT